MTTTEGKRKLTSKTWFKVLLIVILVIAFGGLGYYFGYEKAKTDTRNELNARIELLEDDLDAAKKAAGSELLEGQEAVQEGQQTLQELQTENTQLKSTIEQQNQKIAELEKQLEDAQSETPPPQNQ